MKGQKFQFQYKEYCHIEELTEKQALLVRQAIEAARKAYAPYSSYHVGAALLLEDGEIVTGNNQENAAYPSGMCAERVAIFYAGARFPGLAVTSIAIVALTGGTIQEEPVTPCGACRQVLWENELRGNTPLEVILYGSGKIYVISSARDLLPLPFVLLGNRESRIN
jgi:cytidine deaminase